MSATIWCNRMPPKARVKQAGWRKRGAGLSAIVFTCTLWGSHSWLQPAFSRLLAGSGGCAQRAAWKGGCRQNCLPHPELLSERCWVSASIAYTKKWGRLALNHDPTDCVVLRGRVSDPAAALSGSNPKAPGSAGGYLLQRAPHPYSPIPQTYPMALLAEVFA